MRLHIGLVVLACSLVAAAAVAQDDAKKDLDKLQGTWQVVSVVADGKQLPEDQTKDMTLTIDGDKYTYKIGERTIEGTYKLDPGKDPKAIDATRGNGPDKGKVLRGIYKLDGDSLKMCFNGPDKDERPTAFDAKEGSGHRCYTLKRRK